MHAPDTFPLSFKEVLERFTPWINSASPIYPLNRYVLRRNVAGFPFSERISKNDAKLVGEKLKHLLFSLFPEGLYFKSSELEQGSSQLFFEHLFISHQEVLHPEGGIFIDPNSKVVAIIFLEDHLTFFIHDQKHCSEEMLSFLHFLNEKMEERVPFAFSEKFGFLTSSSSTLGTGLSKEAILHLPAINLLDKTIEESDHTLIHGLNAEKKALHNLIITTNKYCLGVSEKHICSHVQSIAKTLVESEISAHEALKKNPPKELLNTISKHYGQILFCKSLEFHEALDIASSIDLAICLGWIESKTNTYYFDLFFPVRRAHLEAFSPHHSFSIEEKRAALFKEKSEDLKLLI